MLVRLLLPISECLEYHKDVRDFVNLGLAKAIEENTILSVLLAVFVYWNKYDPSRDPHDKGHLVMLSPAGKLTSLLLCVLQLSTLQM